MSGAPGAPGIHPREHREVMYSSSSSMSAMPDASQVSIHERPVDTSLKGAVFFPDLYHGNKIKAIDKTALSNINIILWGHIMTPSLLGATFAARRL